MVCGCYRLEGYACTDDSDCSSRSDGVCLSFGCAYADEACMSGLRYSDIAVGTIAGACVEPENAEDLVRSFKKDVERMVLSGNQPKQSGRASIS